MTSDGEGGAVAGAGSVGGSSTSSSGAGQGGGSASGTGGAGNGSGGNGGDGPFPCAEYVVKDLATPVDRLAITPDRKTLVWTSDPEKGDPGERNIMRISTNGSDPVIVVPGGQLKEVHQLAVDTNNAYWLSGQEMDVNSNPIWYGSFAPLSGPGGIALFAEEVLPPQALAVTDSAIYWTVPSEGRMSVKPPMGVVSQMFTGLPTELNGADSLVVSGGFIYWRRKATPGGTGEAIVYTSDVPPMPPAQATLTELVSTTSASDFIVHPSLVYWTRSDPQNGTINRGTIGVMGTVTKSFVALGSLPFPTHLSVGNANTYWAEGSMSDCSGVVKRLDTGSGNATIKAMSRGDRCVSNFVEDNLFVYWGSGNMICKAPL